MLAEKCYWLNYNALKQLRQILIMVHFHDLYLDQHLSLYFLINAGNNISNLWPVFIWKLSHF